MRPQRDHPKGGLACRLILHLAVLLALGLTTQIAWADDWWVKERAWAEKQLHKAAEAYGADYRTVWKVVDCETGGQWRSDMVGAAGERGYLQWHPRGAWRQVPAYTELGISIWQEYVDGNPGAPRLDLWMGAWAFSPQAPPALKRQWSCYG